MGTFVAAMPKAMLCLFLMLLTQAYGMYVFQKVYLHNVNASSLFTTKSATLAIEKLVAENGNVCIALPCPANNTQPRALGGVDIQEREILFQTGLYSLSVLYSIKANSTADAIAITTSINDVSTSVFQYKIRPSDPVFKDAVIVFDGFATVSATQPVYGKNPYTKSSSSQTANWVVLACLFVVLFIVPAIALKLIAAGPSQAVFVGLASTSDGIPDGMEMGGAKITAVKAVKSPASQGSELTHI